jgi:hypothetical protein
MYVNSVWYLYLVYLQTTNSIYLQNWYMSYTKLIYQQTIFFNKIYAELIWMDGLTKNYWVRYMSRVTSEWEAIRCWDDKR